MIYLVKTTVNSEQRHPQVDSIIGQEPGQFTILEIDNLLRLLHYTADGMKELGEIVKMDCSAVSALARRFAEEMKTNK